MCALMCLQTTLLCEQLITHITGKWMISSMCALMCLQITLLCEQLITHITGKWMISTVHLYTVLVCVLMFLQTEYSAPQTYYIHDLNIGTIHIMYGFLFLRSSLSRDQREQYQIKY